MNQFNGLVGKSHEVGFINEEEILLFGRKLNEARKKLKETKSLKNIAKEIGVGESSCLGWEKGEIYPEREKLDKIAVAYKMEGEDWRDLIKAFEISKVARENEKKVRRGNPSRPS